MRVATSMGSNSMVNMVHGAVQFALVRDLVKRPVARQLEEEDEAHMGARWGRSSVTVDLKEGFGS